MRSLVKESLIKVTPLYNPSCKSAAIYVYIINLNMLMMPFYQHIRHEP